MSVLIRIGKRKAFLRHGRWISAGRELEAALNNATSQWISETGGPPLDDSDQEGTVAREMAERFQGSVLLKTRSKPSSASRYFIEQRQMRLAFEESLPMTRRRAAP